MRSPAARCDVEVLAENDEKQRLGPALVATRLPPAKGFRRAAGADPIRRGQPGYAPRLDRDGDGVGCER